GGDREGRGGSRGAECGLCSVPLPLPPRPAMSVTHVCRSLALSPATSEPRTEKSECGRYGEHSLKRDARGLLAMPAAPQDRQGCDPHARFAVPAHASAWIALIARGNCTYKEKIRNAAAHNASAVVIFNVGSSSTGDIVAIMIPEHKGRKLVSLLERNVTVTMHITIGTRNLQKYVSRTSVVFVSISFIVLMIISLAWLVFYYIQRFRYANARDRNQRRLGDAAKKAIGKLQLRTVRKGDKETESDYDNCAVCIEGYKANDVTPLPQELRGPLALGAPDVSHVQDKHPESAGDTCMFFSPLAVLIHPEMLSERHGLMVSGRARCVPQPNADCMDDVPPDYEVSVGGPPTSPVTGASDITLNESSAVLDPGVRMMGLPQVYRDAESLTQAGEGHLLASGK
ncbi:RING finger protein 150-like, partial [Scleropages formosus]